MTRTSASQLPVNGAYAALAPFYDQLTADHDYELWLNALLPAAERAGLQGRAVLDVACGTGKSFEPLLSRGWSVTACDLSEEMLIRARQRAGGRARIEQADMRDLPRLGRFPLVLCLGDVLNHLASLEEIELCFQSFERNLAAQGVLVFDTNTLHTFRTFFAESAVRETADLRLTWQGLAQPTVVAGALASGRVAAYARRDGTLLMEALQRERHYAPETIVASLEAAGLAAHAIYGHGYDARLEQPLDESRHTKAIFVAKHLVKERR